ncbi:MAG: DNA polymerase III subunit chi [Desulfosoma sp.]
METLMLFVETTAQEQRRDLCRWVERFVDEGRRVFVWTGSTISAQQLNGLLWSFSKQSFVPHRIVTDADDGESAPEPVLIGWVLPERGRVQVLVCDEAPDLATVPSCEMIVHFVPMDDPVKREESRRLWTTAKGMGYAVRHVPKEPAKSSGNTITRRVPSP